MTINETNNFDFFYASFKERIYLMLLTENNNLIKVLKTTECSSFDLFDAYMTSGSTNIIAEAKVKSVPLNKYNTALIIQQKYNDLISLTNEDKYKNKDVKPFYICFYDCGNVAIWDLSTDLTKSETKLSFKDKTVGTEGKMKTHDCYLLKFEEATILKYK